MTDASLQAPPAEDWLGSRRTLDGLASSPLKQINRDNVGNLTLAWSLALPSGTNGITPLVHDGVMFINSDGTVKALSVADGDELWSFSRSAEKCSAGPTRQPAKVDGHVSG
ncbi:PQQ-binding-like beta-propeller repeat protein [Novosphingobium colocasiae]